MAIKSKADIGGDEDDFISSDEEASKQFTLKNNKKTFNIYGKEDSDNENSDDDNNSDNNDDETDNENEFSNLANKKSIKSFIDNVQEESDSDDDDTEVPNKSVEVQTEKKDNDNDDDDDDDDQYYGFLTGENENEEDIFENEDKTKKSKKSIKKVKQLTAKQLEKEEKKIKRTGVVYLSSLPPYMKPQKLRQVMSRFGEIGRIFLKPEDPKVYKSRIKSGGNKKKKFEEGWVEFASKLDAKLAANTLNGNVLGGKKRSFYHDDVMNVKYLKGFKWFDLTNALNREVEVRDSKKQAELSQASKLNKAYIKNVETSKTINRVKESRKRKASETPETESSEIRRNFKQRNVSTNRADADLSIKHKNKDANFDGVLNKIF